MKKRLTSIVLIFCAALALSLPAFALEYTFDGAAGAEYGKATSVDPALTPDGGAAKNEDVSKNAALIPPAFGSPSADTLYTGEYLTPDLVPGSQPSAGTTVGGAGAVQYPPAPPAGTGASSSQSTGGSAANLSTGFTAVSDSLYYSGGRLGTLKIPSIGVSVGIYEGTSTASMRKGAAHFEDTSIWDGNVCLCGHNRGSYAIFGSIHTLKTGAAITLTTKLGTRTYHVTSVQKISETDWSGTGRSAANMITLYTCVRDQPAYRWCVQAVEVV